MPHGSPPGDHNEDDDQDIPSTQSDVEDQEEVYVPETPEDDLIDYAALYDDWCVNEQDARDPTDDLSEGEWKFIYTPP